MKIKHIAYTTELTAEEFKSYWRIYEKYFKNRSRKIKLLLFYNYNSRDDIECFICGTWEEALHFTEGHSGSLIYDSIYILPRGFRS